MVAGRATLLALINLFIFLTGSVDAQEPPPLSGRIEDVDDSGYPEVRAIVTLVDAVGRPIVGLTAEDFAAEESGADASVTSVETVLDQQLGVAVILVIDTSGSMENVPLTQAKIAARTFVENLAEPDQAAVISFAEGVSLVSALSAERNETLAALGGLVAIGNTALFSGVVEAVAVAKITDLPRKAIILLSDGQDFGGASRATRQQALDQAGEAGIPVYAIGLGQDIDRPFLEELSDSSGGAFFDAPAPSLIPAIYEQLSELLRSQYVVSLESTAAADQADRSLRLTVTTREGEVALESDYSTHRTVAAPTTVPVSPTVRLPVLAPSSTEAVDDSGGGGLLLPPLIILVVVGVAWSAFVYYKRLERQRALAEQITEMSQRAAVELDEQNVTYIRHGSSGARTHIIRVSGPELEKAFEIGDEPLVIGSDRSCPIQVPPSAGVAAAHARLWVREGTLMLHHIAPGYESLVGGRSATWVTLESSDEVQIGPYIVHVEG